MGKPWTPNSSQSLASRARGPVPPYSTNQNCDSPLSKLPTLRTMGGSQKTGGVPPLNSFLNVPLEGGVSSPPSPKLNRKGGKWEDSLHLSVLIWGADPRALRPSSRNPGRRKTNPGPNNQAAPPPLGPNPKGPSSGRRQTPCRTPPPGPARRSPGGPRPSRPGVAARTWQARNPPGSPSLPPSAGPTPNPGRRLIESRDPER